MNAESEMNTSDGLGGEMIERMGGEQGNIYAVVVVLEADNEEEAFERISEEVHPEPANAHFVGRPVEVERTVNDYHAASVARQIVAAAEQEEREDQLTVQFKTTGTATIVETWQVKVPREEWESGRDIYRHDLLMNRLSDDNGCTFLDEEVYEERDREYATCSAEVIE